MLLCHTFIISFTYVQLLMNTVSDISICTVILKKLNKKF